MANESLTRARILVIIVARIGDTLLVTPALRALKQAASEGHLTCLAHPQRLDVLVELPWIDELRSITPRSGRWRGWWPSGERWDYAVVFGQDTALVRYALRVAGRVVAFAQRDAQLNTRLWRCVAAPSEPAHAVHERLLLAQALGVTTNDLALAYTVTAAESRAARAWLRQRGLEQGFRVGFQLSSFATKSYRDWPLEHFQALLERLIIARPDIHIIILGDGASAVSAQRLQAQFPGQVTSACGMLRLRESAALMSTLELYIGVDTGPTHLAGALGLPMVAMYHCFHRGRYLAPLQHPKLRVIEHPATDSECTRETPMGLILVDRVWAEVCSLLPVLNAQTQGTA